MMFSRRKVNVLAKSSIRVAGEGAGSSSSSSSSSSRSSNNRSSKQKPNSLGDFLVFWNSIFHIVVNTAELSTIHHVVFGILFFIL